MASNAKILNEKILKVNLDDECLHVITDSTKSLTDNKVMKEILKLSPVKTPNRFSSPTKKSTFISPKRSKRNLNSNFFCSSPSPSKILKIDNTENLDLCQKRKNKKELFSKLQTETIGAFHANHQNDLVERETEIDLISSFIIENNKKFSSKSLYISGPPGTGKTACVTNVYKSHQISKILHQVVSINCMSLSPSAVYQKIAKEFGLGRKHHVSSTAAKNRIEEMLSSSGKMILIILDEMDQTPEDILYSIFDWVTLPNSRLLLIGIANSLDLTDRILPRLQVNIKSKPQLLNFKPYNQKQLTKIMESRLPKNSDEKYSLIDPIAIQLCARKVAASSGDARLCLDVCRRGLENSNNDKVTILKISKLMNDTSLNGIVSQNKSCSEGEFPIQQKLVICSLIIASKKQKSQDINLGKLHEVYSDVCKQRQISSLSQSEFTSICQLIESRGIINVKKHKQNRLSKVRFSLLESDIESILQDKELLGSILKRNS